MEFEIVSHACVSVRAASVRLVVDPWLIGPVYWGAWWHCPEPVYDEGIFRTEYVYITHWHFDHLNRESLKHFDRSTHFLVPKFPVSILVQILKELGFTKITELDHGVPFEMAEGFRITSYQIAYQDDSACFLEAHGVVIANLNDCRAPGSACASLIRRSTSCCAAIPPRGRTPRATRSTTRAKPSRLRASRTWRRGVARRRS